MQDGPAEGYSPLLNRAPKFLRVVIDEETGKRDVLDQLEDVPRADEKVYVYERVTQPGFACGRGRGNSGVFAEYRYRADVDGETVRNTHDWRTWAESQVAAP